MTLIIYTRFLTITSALLNICVRYHFWGLAYKLIEFRKKHIARTIKRELVHN
jgi:hypothetical protein